MNGGAWMLNPNKTQELEEEEEDEESWEVKAFEQDTKGNILGTTWPPRSYTCNFCSREFRSAQALGGHMNVHRRDRASSRAHQGPTSVTAPYPPPFIIQSTASNIEGLSQFYKLQNPNGIFGYSDDLVNLYGTTSFASSNLPFSKLNSHEEVPPPRLVEYSTGDDDMSIGSMKETTGTTSVDEPDLELRLGYNPP